MKPVVSWAANGVLPRAWTNSDAVLTVASLVRMVRTTSTSFMIGAGLKKWRPRTWAGRRVAAASSVIVHDEVFEASSAAGGQMPSSLPKVSFLRATFSVIASITRSASRRSSRRVVPRIRPQAASRAFGSSRPLSASPSRLRRMAPRPRSRRSGLASTTVVGKPAWADTWVMPPPMSPQPTTPTREIAMRPPGRRERRLHPHALLGRPPRWRPAEERLELRPLLGRQEGPPLLHGPEALDLGIGPQLRELPDLRLHLGEIERLALEERGQVQLGDPDVGV